MEGGKPGRRPPARITSREVARAAGVSQSAVSRALANAPGVSEQTRQRIRDISDKLSYQPNALASSLITQRSGIVGIVLSELANPFLSEATEQLLKQLRRRGLQVMVFSAETNKALGDAAFDFGRYRVDGCIVISPHMSRSAAHKYAKLGPAVILFNRAVPGLKASAVSVDGVLAGAKVADFLMERGHTKMGYLNGPDGATAARDRFKGFRERLLEAGLDEPVVANGQFAYDSAAQASIELLRPANRPTAIFCADDIMAMALIDVARIHMGLKIPEELAVVGFDDAPSAAWPSYNLTTIRQPIPEMVAAGIDILVDPTRSTDSPPKNDLFDAPLIIRGTA
jgi:DNA-binding LacI/PurR family transcriptional regulator